jgi:hypothetical protein
MEVHAFARLPWNSPFKKGVFSSTNLSKKDFQKIPFNDYLKMREQ